MISVSKLVYCAASSTLKMEAMFSPEISDDFQWSTRIYIPEEFGLKSVRLYGQRTYIFTLRIEHRRQLFEYKVLKVILSLRVFHE
jgi:hypothetical protein